MILLFNQREMSISYLTNFAEDPFEVSAKSQCQLYIPIYLKLPCLIICSNDVIKCKIDRDKRISFQVCKRHWSSKFLMAQLKQS